uniref:Uncharacterized protein n=1 Tax=Steinernema glaseri TaxID=37863 RepID=A0A1I8ASI9_9BILA
MGNAGTKVPSTIAALIRETLEPGRDMPLAHKSQVVQLGNSTSKAFFVREPYHLNWSYLIFLLVPSTNILRRLDDITFPQKHFRRP